LVPASGASRRITLVVEWVLCCWGSTVVGGVGISLKVSSSCSLADEHLGAGHRTAFGGGYAGGEKHDRF
jgi:hypothetical protein